MMDRVPKGLFRHLERDQEVSCGKWYRNVFLAMFILSRGDHLTQGQWVILEVIYHILEVSTTDPAYENQQMQATPLG